MAQNNYKFKLGSAECELLTGLTFATESAATSFNHKLGVTPDFVIVIPTNEDYVVAHKGADTASVVQLTPEHASATCSALLVCINKGSAVYTV